MKVNLLLLFVSQSLIQFIYHGLVPVTRFSNSLLYKEDDVWISLISKTSPWKESFKNYNFILLVYLSSHGLENRGKDSKLKCVLVNPV